MLQQQTLQLTEHLTAVSEKTVLLELLSLMRHTRTVPKGKKTGLESSHSHTVELMKRRL